MKKLIIEAITEGFPTINISISENENTDIKLHLENGIYNKSKITIEKTKASNVELNNCDIFCPDDDNFIAMVDGKKEKA